MTAYSSRADGGVVDGYFPKTESVDEVVPERAKRYLQQAIEAMHTPSGAVMLAASAVDAMLKHKDYKKGSLKDRIDGARDAHLIIAEMAAWGHNIRLDANDERHADEDAAMPVEADARRSLDFALALAEFLYVLPHRVERGRDDVPAVAPRQRTA